MTRHPPLRATQPRAAARLHTKGRSCDGRAADPPAISNMHKRLVGSHPLPHEKTFSVSLMGSQTNAAPSQALQRLSHLALVEVQHQLLHLRPRPQRHRQANVAALGPLLHVEARMKLCSITFDTTSCTFPSMPRLMSKAPDTSATICYTQARHVCVRACVCVCVRGPTIINMVARQLTFQLACVC